MTFWQKGKLQSFHKIVGYDIQGEKIFLVPEIPMLFANVLKLVENIQFSPDPP
jgi:hypothetical protein